MQPNLTRATRVGVALLLGMVLSLCEASSSLAGCANFGAPITLPTKLPVQDQFRAPLCIWCSGNRGIEYRTQPGTVVSAAASGVVVFAGVVAGTNYVVIKTFRTIETQSNLLVTYGRMRLIAVTSGTVITAGQSIGTAGESLYIGVRIDGQYTDPQQCAGLGMSGKPRAVLVAG